MSGSFANSAQGKTPPCILQLLPRLGIGGAERTALDIARAVAGAGWRSLVASSGGHLQAAIEKAGGEHISLPLHSKSPITALANAFRLERCIRAYGVDLLHARSRMPAWSALLAARRTNIPFVTTYHSTVHAHPAWKRLYNSVMTRSDVVIAKSRFNGERIRKAHGSFPARLEIIVAGIDMEAFSLERFSAKMLQEQRRKWGAGERQVALLAGRLDRNKGHEIFLDALAQIETANRPLGVVLGGSDKSSVRAYRKGLQDRVHALDLEGDVVFAGGMGAEEMPLAYGAVDMVVAPSVFQEPFGRVAVEAQAMERLVIASDIGGFRETIAVDGEMRTGWLVQPGNPAALARAVGQAMVLGTLRRKEMGRRARKHVASSFSMKKMCARTLSLYQELIKKNCGPA